MFALSGYICFHSLPWTAVNRFLCSYKKEYQTNSYRQNKYRDRPYIISGKILSFFLINKPSAPPCSFFFFNITEICLKYYLFLDVLLSFPRHFITCIFPRACLKKAFRELRVPVCGRFYPNEGGVAGYGNRMRVKYTAKWGLQIAEMIFQTRSSSLPLSIPIFLHFILP